MSEDRFNQALQTVDAYIAKTREFVRQLQAFKNDLEGDALTEAQQNIIAARLTALDELGH